MKRIICIGNRYVPSDSAGPAVYDKLAMHELPLNIELIDGGLAGLNLLRYFEGAETVVLVDTVKGFLKDKDASVIDIEEIIPSAQEQHDHSAGLPYLLRVMPQVCELPIPRVVLIGVECELEEEVIEDAVRLALSEAEGCISSTKEREVLMRGV